MNSCINPNVPEFKSLEKLYGPRLAESLVIGYNKNVIKTPSDDLYYPTRKQVSKWLTNNRLVAADNVTLALANTPELGTQALGSMLKGIINNHKGTYFVTRGDIKSDNKATQHIAKEVIFKQNLQVMEQLADRFPNVFRLEKQGETDVVVNINPVQSPAEAKLSKERAGDIYSFNKAMYGFDQALAKSDRSKMVAEALGKKFQKAFGMDYAIISREDAIDILKDTKTPYNNQTAFYFNNQVYFIEGHFNYYNVIHEFAHPLIKGIALNNKKLFDNLFSQLSASAEGQNIINYVKFKYPELDVTSERFMEECLVSALEVDATQKVDKILDDQSAFKKFMTNLIYAIKQVLRKLTRDVDLKTLSSTTTLQELSDMMLNEDFIITDLNFDPSEFAEFKVEDLKEFKTEMEELLDELRGTDAKNLIDAINRTYSEAMFQINTLNATPGKLKEELKGKDGVAILRNLRDYLKKYETTSLDPTQISEEDIIQAMSEQQMDFRERGIALIESINEIEVFSKRIDSILKDMEKSGAHMKIEGYRKVAYYIQFLKRQQEYLDDMISGLGLDESNKLVQKINNIHLVVRNGLLKTKQLQFDFISDFMTEKSSFMQEAVNEKMSARVTEILKQDNYTDAEIAKFIEDIENNPNPRQFGLESSSLTRMPSNKTITKHLLDAIKSYYAKRLVQSDIEDLLKGRKGDIGFGAALLTPYGNIDDPIGAIVRYTKSQLATAEQNSLRQANDIANELAPHLQAVGYSPNSTGQLGEMLLFVDTVPTKDENGNFKKFEVYTVLNRFKNWRADKGELEFNLEKAKEKGDKEAVIKATQALVEFHEKYMHRKYVPEYYAVQKIWTKDNQVVDPSTGKVITVSKDVSTEAYEERQKLLNRMNTFNTQPFTEEDDLYEITESDQLRMEYEELYNAFNPDGTYKTGQELEKVLVRQMHRKESAKFREFVPNYDRVQQDFNHFVRSTLAARGITPDEAPAEGETENRYQKEVNKFFRKNFKIAYTPQYWQDRSRIISELMEINDKVANKDIANELTELFKQRDVFMKMVRDKTGQTNALHLSIAQLNQVKKIENRIVSLQQQLDRKTGLTQEQLVRYRAYESRIQIDKGPQKLTTTERIDYDGLAEIVNKNTLNADLFARQRQLFSELNEIRYVEPTDYYVEAFNEALGGMEIEGLTKEGADEWINSDNVLEAKANSAKFAEWFDRNHYVRSYTDNNGNVKTTVYRTKVWSVERPTDSAYYEKTELLDPITKEPILVPGIPASSKYSYSRVKNEYRTGYDAATGKINLKVGEEVDNKGNFLPRADVTDRKYINEEYVQLERENNARFGLIKAYTKSLLGVQENKPKASKLYLDLPRFRQTENMEFLQSGKAKETVVTNVKAAKNAVLAVVKSAQDDQERGFNYNADAILITTDLQGEPITSVPVRGLYKLEKSDVSQDVLKGLSKYLYSLNAQESLIQAAPIVEALSDVLNDPKNAIDRVNQASATIKKRSNITKFIKEKNNRRAEALDYFIDKVYYGQAQNQFAEEHVVFNKISQRLMGSAHRAFSALDIPSALKNKYGMLFQTLVETAGGKYITHQSLALGRAWSYSAMVQLSSRGIYTRGPKSLMLQMMERFDPITGKTRTDFGHSTSRTFIKDLLDATWMYDARKFMEVQEGLTLFAAMMYKKTVEQKLPDGSVKQIKYIDAFELDANQQLKLKDGIDPEYDTLPVNYEFKDGDTLESISKQFNVPVETLVKNNKIKDASALKAGDDIVISSNDKFIDFRLKIQGVGKKLNGMTDDVDSAQANKYLGFRLFSFYKKFAVPMFLNRFQMDTSKENRGGEVYDWDLGETTRGYYITAFLGMKNLLSDVKNYWPLMTKDEKIAIRKVLAEGLYLALMGIAVTMIFGYDPGDEDRFEKMRAREEKYGYFGWAANHALYQLIAIRKENEAFIPIPGIGLEQWLDFTDSTSIVTGPTIELYSKLIVDLFYMATGDEKAMYKREVGPYGWQEEGRYKLWNHLGSVFGIKGKTAAPIWAIKKFEMYENLG